MSNDIAKIKAGILCKAHQIAALADELDCLIIEASDPPKAFYDVLNTLRMVEDRLEKAEEML